MFRIFVVLGSAFMILLIIIYWDDVGASHFYLHTPVSPGPKVPHPVPQKRPQTSRAPSFLSDIDAFVNQFLEPGTGEPTDAAPADTSNQSEKAEERYIPRREWKIHLTPLAPELRDRQVNSVFIVVSSSKCLLVDLKVLLLTFWDVLAGKAQLLHKKMKYSGCWFLASSMR